MKAKRQKGTKVRIKDRRGIAFILSSILLFMGICATYTGAYSSFASLKYQSKIHKREIVRETDSVAVYEKACTTGMIYGNRNALSSIGRVIFRNNFAEFRFPIPENQILVNKFFYYTTVSTVFSPLFDRIQGILRYIHNQDGEK